MIISNSVENTLEIAQDFANKLNPGDIVLLIGKVGSGKTTFAKGIAKALGIKKRILSPTFSLVRSYKVNKLLSKKNITRLHHIDLYRIGKDNEIKNLIKEYSGSDSVLLIEWPKSAIVVEYNWKVELSGNEKKQITITKSN